MPFQYIILDEQKRATHSFKDGIGAKPWKEVEQFDNVALIVPTPFIILDFDTEEDAKIMLDIIEQYDLQCRVMKTNRGIHVWFRSSEPWKCFVKTRLACGIYADCKSHSKNAYVKIKDSGVMRPWLRKCELEEIQEVPEWLVPISTSGNKFDFKGMKEGDGRNQELFNYIIYLQSKGLNKSSIRKCIEIINTFVFSEPLDEVELTTICRDDAFQDEKLFLSFIDESGKFVHSELGKELIKEYNIITVNNRMYVYKDGYYQEDSRIIEQRMIQYYPNIKTQQRNEVLQYIKITTHLVTDTIERNPYIINLKNTRLNIQTGEILDFTPDAIEFERIPIIYSELAYSSDIDKLFNRVFEEDVESIHLIEEMLGYCLIKHCKYEKGFLLTGSGSNGKSTFLELVKAFLGDANYSSLELDKVTNRFSTASLENKLANIGDDINSKILSDTGTLKKLFSGQSLEVERKGVDGYTLRPYAKHIYSCNEIPRAYDKTDGFYRRWIMIPFNAKFSVNDEDYDPLIGEKIVTDNSLSYLLNRALIGAKRLIQNGRFTQSDKVRDVLEEYKISNSLVLSWIDDTGITQEYLLANSQNNLYIEFESWCRVSNIKDIPNKRRFNKEIYDKYDFEWIQRRNPMDMEKKINYFTYKC